MSLPTAYSFILFHHVYFLPPPPNIAPHCGRRCYCSSPVACRRRHLSSPSLVQCLIVVSSLLSSSLFVVVRRPSFVVVLAFPPPPPTHSHLHPPPAFVAASAMTSPSLSSPQPPPHCRMTTASVAIAMVGRGAMDGGMVATTPPSRSQTPPRLPPVSRAPLPPPT